MRNPFLILFLLCIQSISAQDNSEEILLDYGVISKGDNRVKEITLRTGSAQLETILRIGASENEFDIRFSSKEISAQKSVVLRIKFNPRTKGTKNYDIPIYFSRSKPINIQLKADVRHLEWEDYTPCPDFSDNPKSNDFRVTLKVVDSSNGEPIKNAEIAIAEQGVKQAVWKTNRKGIIEKQVPLGYYSMLAAAKDYSKSRKEGYINRRNKYFIFALDPNEAIIGAEDVVLEESAVPETENKEEVIEVEIAQPEEQVIVLSEELKASIDEFEEEGEFSLNQYSQNNVVFLIDVSTSMKREERLEILKSSMIELLDLLRPQDRLSIITYASSTDVVMNSRFVTDKPEIAATISALEGKGLTAGENGIKKAYAMAKKNFIEGGNNQVYLATDGAFNKGETDVSKFVKRQRKNELFMSIIAVKSPKWTIPKMEKIAKDASGDYVQISDFENDKQKLNDLIKKQSKKLN